MTLTISSELHRQLLSDTAESPHAEICGLLIGSGRIERVVPARNVSTDPARLFEIDPAVLFAAIRAERSGQGDILGYYHSHPSGPPEPSPRDVDQAIADGRIWLIIGEGRVLAWRLDQAKNFCGVELLIVD